jgi:hypothetical protein
MNEKQAEAIAEALDGVAWNSGGNGQSPVE